MQNICDEEEIPVPEIRPPTEAEIAIVGNESTAEVNGTDLIASLVVHRKTTADFVLLLPYLPETNCERHSIVVVIRPGSMPLIARGMRCRILPRFRFMVI